MTRTKGSTASKPCDHCGYQNIIFRKADSNDLDSEKAFNYIDNNRYDGKHTCFDADGNTLTIQPFYKDGVLVTDLKCPDCNGPMVTRTARKGKHKGNNFWGCKRFPDCKGIINFELKPMTLSDTQAAAVATATAVEPDYTVFNDPKPTPEPIQEPTVATTNETTNITLDFNGAITSIVEQALAKGSANYLGQADYDLLENKIEELETSINNATPRVVSIDVTANNVTVGHVEGSPHMKFDRILKSIARRKNTWMCGPTGSGKTTAAQMAAKALSMEYTEVACGPETDQYELFGHITPDGRYIEGKIRKVFEFGGILMLDEIDNSNAAALVSMNTALSNGGAMFPDGYVTRHSDFVCLAGANTWGNGADRQYVGRTEIDAATISRFKFIDFDYDETAERDWAGHDQKLWVDFVLKVRHAAFDRGLEVIVSPRASINGASELRDGDDFLIIADEYVWNPMSQSDKDMLKSAINWDHYINFPYKQDGDIVHIKEVA